MKRTSHEKVIVGNKMVPEKLFQLRDYGRKWLTEVNSWQEIPKTLK